MYNKYNIKILDFVADVAGDILINCNSICFLLNFDIVDYLHDHMQIHQEQNFKWYFFVYFRLQKRTMYQHLCNYKSYLDI